MRPRVSTYRKRKVLKLHVHQKLVDMRSQETGCMGKAVRTCKGDVGGTNFEVVVYAEVDKHKNLRQKIFDMVMFCHYALLMCWHHHERDVNVNHHKCSHRCNRNIQCLCLLIRDGSDDFHLTTYGFVCAITATFVPFFYTAAERFVK